MARDLVVEVGHRSLTKHGEAICGDWVKVTRTHDSTLLVVSDGLGSGVKANILATMTTEIATSMMRHGARIDEMVETIAATLPICKIRQIAYATFTILHIVDGRHAYLVEYDCPQLFFVRDGEIIDLPRVEREIAGRKVHEATFDVREDDYLVCVSDGVVHAGVGGKLSFGWGWKGVASYLAEMVGARPSAYALADAVLARCSALYDDHPGDDVTIVATRVRPAIHLTVLTGPPSDRDLDPEVVHRFLGEPGQKAVCGGTTTNIVARYVKTRPDPVFDGVSDVPPAAYMPSVGLVTEGVVTLNRAIQRLQAAETAAELPNRHDGATELARSLLEADHIKLMVGDAINPAQVADVIRGQAFRQVLVDTLVRELQRKGKIVEIEHY
jgi:hypothetical protein